MPVYHPLATAPGTAEKVINHVELKEISHIIRQFSVKRD